MEARTGLAQTVSAERTYDAFGQVVTSSGIWNGQFGYAGGFGYQEDGDYGLKLPGHRYYDPSTGRFLTRDPIKDGRNWYGYCNNNPVAYQDSTGGQAEGVLGAAAVAALVDGPLPVGDVVALGILVVGGVSLLVNPPRTEPYSDFPIIKGKPFQSEEHTKNKQKSNREKHENGQARQKRDQGREKGDARRNQGKPKNPPTQPSKDSPEYKKGPKIKPAVVVPGYDKSGSGGVWH